MQVSEMMTPSVDVLGPDTHLQEVARHMRDHDIGALPVARDDRLVGVVTDRDIVVRCLAQMSDLKGATAANAMSEEVLYCFDDQDIDDVARNMGQQQVRRLFVVDRDKRLIGVLSLGDIAANGKQDAAAEALSGIAQPDTH